MLSSLSPTYGFFASFLVHGDNQQSKNSRLCKNMELTLPFFFFLGFISCERCSQSVPFINFLLLLLLVARFVLLLLPCPVSLECVSARWLRKMSLSGLLLVLLGDLVRVQVRIVGSVVLKTARNCLYFYTADVALSQKLQEELSYENETGGTSSDVPQFLKDFQAQNVWTVSTLFHVSCVLLCSFLSMTLPT